MQVKNLCTYVLKHFPNNKRIPTISDHSTGLINFKRKFLFHIQILLLKHRD